MAIPGQPDFASSFGLIEPIDVFGNYEKGRTLELARLGQNQMQGAQAQQAAAGVPVGPLGAASATPLPAGAQNGPINNQMQTAQLFKQQEAQRLAQEQAQARAAEKNAEQIALSKNFTVNKAREFVTRYPEEAEAMKSNIAAASEAEKAAYLDAAGAIYSALTQGAPDVAEKHARDMAEVFRAQNPQQADRFVQMANLINQHPELAKDGVGKYIAVNGGETLWKAIGEQEQSEAALLAKQAQADKARVDADVAAATALDTALADLDFKKETANNLRSEIVDRAKRFNLDAGKVAAEIAKLKAETSKIGSEMSEKEQTDYSKALSDATFDNLLADDAENALKIFEDNSINFTEKDKEGNEVKTVGSVASGVANTLTSPFKQGLGGAAVGVVADAAGVTRDLDVADAALRRAVAEDIKKNRAPGDQSNAELKVAMDAQLSKLAGPKAKADYMRKHIAEKRLAANLSTAKASFLGQNKGLGPAKQDIRIPTKDGDIIVPKGGSLQDAVGALSVKRVPKEEVEKTARLKARIRSMKDAGMTAAQITATLKKERDGG